MTTSSTERITVHQAITNQIITVVDADTGHVYRGVNTVALCYTNAFG